MATVQNILPSPSPGVVVTPTENIYKPFSEPFALKGLKGIARMTSMMGATVIFISPLAIIAFITLFGDRFVGTPHPNSIWFVMTTFSKMGAICLAVLAVVGAISASIFVFSHVIKLSADRMERMSTQGNDDPDVDLEVEPIGVFDRRIAAEQKKKNQD
jgi:hypothetical protein